MSFAYPGFLWALFTLAIPIIIHLFNFRRVQKIFFSNTRLLRQVKEETTKRRRIKHWLILLSRLLFLLFLVLAFAQPYFPASEQLSSGKNVVLYVDNSYSMSAPMPDKTRALDAANGLVTEIINTFPQDTRYKLLTNDFAPFSNNYKTKAEITDLLSQIRFSNVSRSMAEIQKKVESTGNPDIFFLSDFQKSTIGRGQLTDTTMQWRLVPVQTDRVNNIFIDSAWFENPYLTGGDKNRLHVWVRNDGTRNADHLSIKLTINNVLAATATLSIPGNGTTTATFDIAANANQYQELKITLQDFPISFDNEFYLAMMPLQRLKIVDVRGSQASRYFENVYGNRDLFEFKTYQATNIDFPQLEKADLVIFNELPDFDEPIRQTLASGLIKSFLVVPARQIKVSSYQAVVGLPIQAIEKPSQKDKLSVPDFRNPFFENVFEEKSTAMEMPTATRIFQWGSDPSAILKLRDGSPFLSLTSKGFVLASPLQKEFTDFPQHALFVPVMYKMAAIAKKDIQRSYYFLSENFISIPSDSLAPEEPVRLTGAKEVIPTQRYVTGRILMDIPKFALVPGFFYIATKTDSLGLLAFNLDKDESRMEMMTLPEIRKTAGDRKNISIFEPGNRQAFSNEIKARYLGEPLWKYCLGLALLFLLMEILLIRLLK
jgi:hypothetical protein